MGGRKLLLGAALVVLLGTLILVFLILPRMVADVPAGCGVPCDPGEYSPRQTAQVVSGAIGLLLSAMLSCAGVWAGLDDA
jgi:hypothetical protein